MNEFCCLNGAVYIFENPSAHRVKVGMTIGATSTVADRLRDANDKWLERKVTCQICGGRLVNIDGLVPQHQYVLRGKGCPGGNALPIEKDVTLAVSYLENMKNRLNDLSGSEKGSATRIIITLNDQVLTDSKNQVPGRFTLYPTSNMYNFILLYQVDGRTWQVQWSTEPDNRMILPINDLISSKKEDK